MDEQQLAARLQSKDERALAEAIQHYTPLAATIIYNISRGTLTKEDIEEVVADVFVTLWHNTTKIHPDTLKGYLCCIAKTRALNKLASVKRPPLNIEDYDVEDDFSISDVTETKDIHHELRELIQTIPDPDREMLMRYYFYYQSTPKIAQTMGFNVETVKYRLKRTRQQLKVMLTERGYTL